MKIFPFKLDISLPEKVTVPESISESFKTDRPMVVLPDPDSPTSPKISPHRYQS